MKAALAWLRARWAIIAAFLGFAGYVLLQVLKRRDPQDHLGDVLTKAEDKARRKVEVARARELVERTVIRTKDAQARDQLQAILEEKDEAKRGAAIIDMAARNRSTL